MLYEKKVNRRCIFNVTACFLVAGLATNSSSAATTANDLAYRTLRVINGNASGSAVPFSGNLAFTAEHVVDHPEQGISVEVYTPASYPSAAKRYQAVVVAADRGGDLAVIRVAADHRLPGIQLCPLQNSPSGRFRGVFAGCSGRTPRARSCVVKGLMNCRISGCRGRRWATVPAPTKGDSGGPLIDARTGYLIGIVSTGGRGVGGFSHLSDMHRLAAKVTGNRLPGVYDIRRAARPGLNRNPFAEFDALPGAQHEYRLNGVFGLMHRHGMCSDPFRHTIASDSFRMPCGANEFERFVDRFYRGFDY